jgi:hypothetical protein
MVALTACEIVVRPDSARPALSVVAGFVHLGGGVAKRGRPGKPDAKRKPCGRLASVIDEGHEMVLQHRAELVGAHNKHSRFADSVIGRLYLAGGFGKDEKLAERRHNVLRDYAEHNRLFYGPSTAQAINLAKARGRGLPGADDALAGLYARHKAAYAALMILPPGPGCRLLTHQVVERAVLYDIPPASPAELACLVRAADRLRELKGDLDRPEDFARGRRKKAPPSDGSRGHRGRDILAIYSREVFGPSDEQLAEALKKFRLLPPAGEAD